MVVAIALLLAANLLTRADQADERFARAMNEFIPYRLQYTTARPPKRSGEERTFRRVCFQRAAAYLSLMRFAPVAAKTRELMLFAWAVAGRSQLQYGVLFIPAAVKRSPDFKAACVAVQPVVRSYVEVKPVSCC